MASRYIVPALALAASVAAQSCSGPYTINTQSDASSLSSCITYTGDITISGNYSGDLQIDGLRGLDGSLKCYNASAITSLSTDQLNTISGTFDLQGLTILSTLSMSSLSAVNVINWITLPGLQQLTFPIGVSRANTVYISDTALTTLSGIELTAVGTININNNQFLKTINVGSLTNVTSALALAANGPNLAIEFPTLRSAANVTIRDVSSVSLPALYQIAGAMGLYSNSFSTFSAPNLTAVGQTVAFVSNMALNNISLPSLIYVGGGLQIANNTQLQDIDGFNALANIGGDINFYGTFAEVEFNALGDVRGAANVYTSSQNSSICSLFQAAKSHQIIKGNVNCHTGDASQNGSSNSSSSGSGSKNAADSLTAISTPLTAIAAVLVSLLFM